MMAMMTGEGEGGGGSWAGSPPRRGVSAHLERRSVTPPAGAVSLFRSTFRQKKNKKNQFGRGSSWRNLQAWKGLERFQPALPSPERWDHCAGLVPSSHFSADSARS